MRDCAKVSVMRYRSGMADTSLGPVRLVVGNGTNYVVLHDEP